LVYVQLDRPLPSLVSTVSVTAELSRLDACWAVSRAHVAYCAPAATLATGDSAAWRWAAGAGLHTASEPIRANAHAIIVAAEGTESRIVSPADWSCRRRLSVRDDPPSSYAYR